jgi:hypothetical protein
LLAIKYLSTSCANIARVQARGHGKTLGRMVGTHAGDMIGEIAPTLQLFKFEFIRF